MPYAELHCHSNFSLLDGASHPEELVEAAARLELDAIALTDHDGMYGVVRFAEAAKELGVHTVFGAELSIGLRGRSNGDPDPEGDHLLLLAAQTGGLPPALPHAHHRSPRRRRGEGQARLRPGTGRRRHAGATVVVLTGLPQGNRAPGASRGRSRRGVPGAGRARPTASAAERVYVELTDHGLPEDSTRNDVLTAMAQELELPIVATNAVHYATPNRGRLAAAMAAVRARQQPRRDGRLAAACARRVPAQRRGDGHAVPPLPRRRAQRRVARHAVAFDLRLVAPKLPPFDVPPDHTESSFLRKLTYEGARRRYSDPTTTKAFRQIEHELKIIEQLDFPGYFLVVHDIVAVLP